MKKHTRLAIAAAAIAFIAAIFVPPNIRLHVEFETNRPQPVPPSSR